MSSLLKEIEEFAIALPCAKLHRNDLFGSVVVNGYVYPARNQHQVTWSDDLFSPKGLSILFNTMNYKNKV